MTDAEKELIDLLDRHIHHPILSDIKTVGDLAKALIQRYPSILAEKVFSGETVQISATTVYKNTVTQQALFGSTELTNIEVFIRQVKSKGIREVKE